MKAAFIPEVNDELDTQNFEKFEEVNLDLWRNGKKWLVFVHPLPYICSNHSVICRLIIKFRLHQNRVHGERLVSNSYSVVQ